MQNNFNQQNGLLLLDKPQGLSSNQALGRVKRLFGIKKAGHTGTLDPLATGMLPICLGEATKFSAYGLHQDKRYWARIKLGETTTTGDAEGEVLEVKSVPFLSTEQLSTLIQSFEGEIEQVPPMYSALKYQGRPLYELARQGITIERKARHIKIYQIQLKSYEMPYLELEVACSKGTYIRTLAEDIGQKIGCGGHIVGLRRLSVGDLQEAGMFSLEQLEYLKNQADLARALLPMETLIHHFPEICLSSAEIKLFRQGQSLQLTHEIEMSAALYRIYESRGDSNKYFWGLAEALEAFKIKPKRIVNRLEST